MKKLKNIGFDCDRLQITIKLLCLYVVHFGANIGNTRKETPTFVRAYAHRPTENDANHRIIAQKRNISQKKLQRARVCRSFFGQCATPVHSVMRRALSGPCRLYHQRSVIGERDVPPLDHRFNKRKGGDPMSHGATPVIAAAFGLAVMLTAGIASADCSPTHQSVSLPQTPATDTVAKPTISTPGSTRG